MSQSSLVYAKLENMQYQGSFVALITPFNRKGKIDRKSLEKLIEWHIAEGTDGIVCCGTTGEFCTLSDREKLLVAQICLDTASSRIPIIVGTGSSATRETCILTEKAQKLGAQGCLVVTPFYNKPTPLGLSLHFQEVGKVGLPVIVYHNPGRTGARYSAETIASLEKIEGITAIKTSCDLALFQQIRKLTKLPLFAGEDDLTYAMMQNGAAGAISVIGNLIPRGWRNMIDLCLKGDWTQAELLSQRYAPLCKALFLETNPQPVKWAVKWLGLIANGTFRLPLGVPSLEVQAALKSVFVSLALTPGVDQKKGLAIPG